MAVARNQDGIVRPNNAHDHRLDAYSRTVHQEKGLIGIVCFCSQFLCFFYDGLRMTQQVQFFHGVDIHLHRHITDRHLEWRHLRTHFMSRDIERCNVLFRIFNKRFEKRHFDMCNIFCFNVRNLVSNFVGMTVQISV